MYTTSVKVKYKCTHEVDKLPCRGGSEEWVRTLKSEIKIMNQCTEHMHIVCTHSLLYQGKREHEWKVHPVQVGEA